MKYLGRLGVEEHIKFGDIGSKYEFTVSVAGYCLDEAFRREVGIVLFGVQSVSEVSRGDTHIIEKSMIKKMRVRDNYELLKTFGLGRISRHNFSLKIF